MRTDIIMQNLVGISRAYGRIGLISFLLLLWSSSGIFVPLEKALNRAWEVTVRRRWWQSRLLALEMAFVVGCLILIATTSVGRGNSLPQTVESITRGIPSRPGGISLSALNRHQLFCRGDDSVYGTFSAASQSSYEPAPSLAGRVAHRCPLGSGPLDFRLLLPFFNYRHVYGSIGVMVSLMTWAYISSAVILFGAQISRSLYGTFKIQDPSPRKGSPFPLSNHWNGSGLGRPGLLNLKFGDRTTKSLSPRTSGCRRR